MTVAVLHTRTPLIESFVFSAGMQRVWLKMESLQPSGSFKNRGIGAVCQHNVAAGAKKLVSSSGGNAGIATAYCGMRLGVPVEIVVPESAPATSVAAMKRFGAAVRVHGASWIEAHQMALTLIDENSVLIHPFEDPLLWPGHASMIDEVVEQGCKPDVVVLSVGGGGLICGVAQGLTRNALGDTEIIAVETLGAASFAAAVKAGKPVMLNEVNTIANTLAAKQVAQAAFDVSQSHRVSNLLVSDQQALDACKRFVDDHRVLVEPACGAALATLYDHPELLTGKQNILVIVCGGMGVSLAQFDLWQKQIDQRR